MRLRSAVPLAAALFLAAVPARADRKFYLFTYQYATLPKGAAELESWITREDDDSVPKQIDGELKVEGEFGITDRFDVSLYTILTKEGDESLDWDASSIEMKYRLGQAGQWPVDVELYAEYEQPFQVHGWGEPEFKLILAHDFGPVNVAGNLVFVKPVDDKTGTHLAWQREWAAGVSYEVSPKVNVGVEGHGSFTDSTGKLGPVVSYQGEKAWVAIGPYFGLTSRDGDVGARAILGFYF
ncbi:MAG TPA: hypothetical protein VFL12_12540 [Thermoanaerobaculia bacterium]|nr:hypothetical protein [Thermoanaerobaculia bacterium]